MRSRHMTFLGGLALAIGCTSVVQAADKGPWSVAVYAGDAVSSSGTLKSPTTATVGNLGTLNPALAGASGNVSFDRLRYHELFHNRFSAALEVGYASTENLQFYGRFGYDARQGREQDIGVLTSPAVSGPQRVIAHFGNSDSRGLEVGARYYWLAQQAWRPYVAVTLGSTRTDEMYADLVVAKAGIDLKHVRFADAGNVFSQSFETGVEFAPSEQFGLRFSVRANHIGTPPSAGDPRLAQLGFNPGDDAGNRVSYPVSIAGVYRF